MDRARIEELFAPFVAVSVKRMFGGHGVYADGLFFAIEAGGEIYLKADRHSAARFEEAGSRPFVYQGKDRPIAISYWSLPDQALEDADELVDGRSLRLKPRSGQARNGRFRPRAGARRQIPLGKTAKAPTWASDARS
jgi:DNA transformation protein